MVFIGTDLVIAYISYVLAAYTLTVWCFKIPHLIKFFKTFKNENRYARRWQDDTRLRRLDVSVTQNALIVALTLGIVGALILGFGMSLIMTDLGEILGDYKDMAMVVGIIVGVVGGVIASLAYPIYNAIVKAKRKKLAPEIIRLTDELMK